MAAPTNLGLLALGPGALRWAPLGSTKPVNTVAGSVFTDAWPAAWLAFGATDEGSEFSYGLDTDKVTIAEMLDAAKVVTTGRTITIGFALAEISPTNFKRAFNGGTITTTGATTTTLTKYVPPALGAETRCMIGWESDDLTERLLLIQTFQTGTVAIRRRKGADKATLPVEYTVEAPAAGGDPFEYYTAGATRV